MKIISLVRGEGGRPLRNYNIKNPAQENREKNIGQTGPQVHEKIVE